MDNGPWEEAGGSGGGPGGWWWPGTGDTAPRGQHKAEVLAPAQCLFSWSPPLPFLPPLQQDPLLFIPFHQETYLRPWIPSTVQKPEPSLPCQPQIAAPSPAPLLLYTRGPGRRAVVRRGLPHGARTPWNMVKHPTPLSCSPVRLSLVTHCRASACARSSRPSLWRQR